MGPSAGNAETCLDNPKAQVQTPATVGETDLGSTQPFQTFKVSFSAPSDANFLIALSTKGQRGAGRLETGVATKRPTAEAQSYLQILLGDVRVGDGADGPGEPGPLGDAPHVPAVVAAVAAVGCGQAEESLPHQHGPTFCEREHHGFHACRKGSSLQKHKNKMQWGRQVVGGR